jgi:hypothetical protein
MRSSERHQDRSRRCPHLSSDRRLGRICTASILVELFLFPNVTHGGLQVLDYRVSGAESGEDSKQACLRRLRDAPSS